MAKVRKMCSGREYCSAQIASLFRRWNAREYLFGENEIAATIERWSRMDISAMPVLCVPMQGIRHVSVAEAGEDSMQVERDRFSCGNSGGCT